MRLAAVILAAGKGTRMKSKLPKVLHQVGGKPMLGHVLDAVVKAGAEKTVVVAGYGAEQVESFVGNRAQVVYQEQQLGTAHALMQAAGILESFPGHILVVCGDTPLITPETLSQLVKCHADNQASATVLTTVMQDPTGYGRVIRDEQGRVDRIVEQKDGTPEELAVQEINTGFYCFAVPGLFDALKQISSDNAQGEYYLPDIIKIYNRQNKVVAASLCNDPREVMGVNNRQQLAAAEKELRARVLNRLMNDGVTVIDPAATYVDSTVTIEPDTVLYPGTILEGDVKIAGGCYVGPNTRIVSSIIGPGCRVQYSVVMDSEIGPGCTIGPFAYIRPECKLGSGVKIGDFVEVKKSEIGNNSKVPHLSYIGDSIIGKDVNVGAGTITCNYDGKKKHRTEINDGAFIGSNTNLVAPVKVGAGAVIAAGSTITKDVPRGALGVARGRQINKENWVKKGSK
ncbi:bifunctional UDP-N-acetylglucosamine pyrophosphorylase/glucosamine-1-phosphate N-acetyltransferase [Desulfohalotomaculum tongense]|uniref:bifunctional UDP-N-acetylglucosamine diphosphorylase/glucosamine-1-phosphate N-acetyltransferase GlmU n=1 Tax=Desulforadius tongensis TaxID=1216062 RepID=UPI0019578E77|nr:bifunctional UDP-N-acetylglucosamine diphosphorylase/glucosamine-1-phosphate N-acetyltransferase GlmU [Desulforadius tongensis]MBM7855204.1 bifunctional UDP-N-acetylglucosamine pyrophosphorylase/glucosamine-1-phosphate N-acetyltransferase [Desulforadius tongensis]